MKNFRHQLKSTRAAFGGLALLLSCPLTDVAIGQTVLDTAAVFHTIGDEAAVDRRNSPSAMDSAGGSDVKPSLLRHLPLSSAGWRVEGETGTLSWRIYLTGEDIAEMRAFRLAYFTAASVLPDASTLELRINNVRIAQRTIATPGERRPVDLAIPSDTLQHGFNTVTLVVEQHHRVDCTRDAAYELWTEIDPAKTGFVGATSPVPGLSSLPALRARPDGALVIRVLFQGKMRPQRIDQTIRAAQAIALAGRFDHTLVSFAPERDEETGVNLIVGTSVEIAGVLGSSTDTLNASSPAVSLRSVDGLRAPVLVVSGVNDDEVAAAIAQIAVSSKRDQSLSSTAAAARVSPIQIEGGERIRLDAIGLPDTDFRGRLFRIPFAIEMPADFLAADYDKIFFAISGQYSGDLTDAAHLTIHINGQDAASVPLPKPSSAIFSRNDIGVPLSFFRPGRNMIEITAALPDRNHDVCSTTGESGSAGNRFKLLGDSEIRVPHLARIAQMPALLQTAAGGYPYASSGTAPKLYVPVPDRDALSAAATLAVRLSVAARQPIPFQIVLSNPTTAAEHGLVVAPARALDPELMRAIQFDPDSVQRLWQKPAPSGELRIAAPSTLRRTTHPSLDWVSDRITALRSRIFGDVMPIEINADAALIVAQGYQKDGGGVITVVTAPDSAMLSQSVGHLVGPQRWSELRGRLAVMSASARILQVEEPSHVRLIQTQPASLRNVRLITAGWLSLHPAVYVAAALLIAALLAAASTSLVKNLGRRNS